MTEQAISDLTPQERDFAHQIYSFGIRDHSVVPPAILRAAANFHRTEAKLLDEFADKLENE